MTQSNQKLNCRQVAEILEMSISWVYLHTKPGSNPRLPHQRIGRALRFRRDEIEGFMNKATYSAANAADRGSA